MVSLGSCPSPGGQTASTMALVLKTKRKSSLKPVSVATLVLLTSALVSAAPPTLQIPRIATPPSLSDFEDMQRSEERRVGKECSSGWWPHHYRENEHQTYCGFRGHD